MQNNIRIGAKAAVYTSAIFEYLTVEVSELAGAPRLSVRFPHLVAYDVCEKVNTSKSQYHRVSASCIMPQHLQLVIRGDEELEINRRRTGS
jgi:histone H2A